MQPMPSAFDASGSPSSFHHHGNTTIAETRQDAGNRHFCAKCGDGFLWEDDPHVLRIFGKRLVPMHCEDCEKTLAVSEADDSRLSVANRDRERRARLEAQWIAMVGPYYTGFNEAMLPAVIRPHVRSVLEWDAQSAKGVGFLGTTYTGKSRLIHALGYRLHMAGHDVFATSGIEFQEKCTSQVHDPGWRGYLAQCCESAILVLDDADKLRLTDAVEAAYYGMLERRRKWCLPVLATLNVGGDTIASMGSASRGGPIATRLRDLCGFIPLP